MLRLWRPLALFAFYFGPPAQSQRQDSWQQENSWQQQNIASNPSFGDRAATYSAPYGRRGRQYSAGFTEQSFGERSQLQSMAEAAASANGIPVSLVDRVIRRESGGNPRAVNRGNYGLM